MAEYVRWRFTKLRTGVTLALFGLLAGLGIRSSESSPNVAIEPAASTNVPHNSIGSAQIKLHSLLLSDFKVHEVASYDALSALSLKWRSLSSHVQKVDTSLKLDNKLLPGFLKIDDAATKYLKIDDASASYLKLGDAAAKYLKIDGTAGNALKIDGLDSSQIVQGHGQVITGNAAVTSDNHQLMAVPGLVTVSVALDPSGKNIPQAAVTNTSGHTLLVNGGDISPGVPARSTQSFADGALLPAVQLADGSVRTLQIVVEARHPGTDADPVVVRGRQCSHRGRSGRGGYPLTALAIGLPDDGLALSNTVDAFEGARAAVLHAPGLFRLDMVLSADNARVMVRNLSPGQLEYRADGYSRPVFHQGDGELTPTLRHSHHQVGFTLGAPGDAVNVEVVLATMRILDRGIARITAQATVRRGN